MPSARWWGPTSGLAKATSICWLEFQPDEPGALYKTYFSLLNELRETLASRIDLVMVEAIRNPYVKASIETSKQEIDAA